MPEPELTAAEADEFFGRVGLVRRIMARIGAGRPQSVAVIGGRRSGKSSLLAFLSDPDVKKKWLESEEDYLFIPIRTGSDGAATIEDFFGTLADRLGMRLAARSDPYEGIRLRIEELHGMGRRIIILLDDFHHVTGNDDFPVEFFSFLRSMANNYNLAYVTTSLLELQTLCVAKEVQESPFFNIFTNMHLGMLTVPEATALLVHAADCDAGLASFLATWCGGSPYLVRKTAAAVVSGQLAAGSSEAELATILLPGFAPHFEEVLAMLPAEAFRPLQAVSRGKAPNQADEHRLGPLVKQGFLVEGPEGLSPFSPAFGLFLQKSLNPRMFLGRC